MRSCIVCRQYSTKRTLVRFVRTAESTILYDASSRLNGRGAYICRAAACLNEAIKKQTLQRVLKAEMPECTLVQIKELVQEIGE